MSGRAIIGIVLVLLGIGVLAGQYTSFDVGAFVSDWWPMILVFIGAVQIATRSAPLVGALLSGSGSGGPRPSRHAGDASRPDVRQYPGRGHSGHRGSP